MLRKLALINFHNKEVMKMLRSSEQALDSIFLSYNKILNKLHNLGLTTKYEKEISHVDLRKSYRGYVKKNIQLVDGEVKKVRSRKYFVLIEGYYWLLNVYFQKEKSLTDADIDFF